MVALVGPPLFTLWWPLVIHHLLYWELYKYVWVGDFDRTFWRDLLVLTAQILLPYWLIKLLLFSDLRDRLKAWSGGAKLLYLSASAGVFCGFVAWQGTLQNGPTFRGTFWIAWVLLSLWLSPFRIFWSAFLERQDLLAHPPYWVGEVGFHNWRYRAWHGFIAAVLRLGGYLTGEQKTTDSNVFGAAPRPTRTDLEKAGLV